MIVNGKQLLAASPIVGMLSGKEKAGGVTHGLAEVGYDVRIKQGLHFTYDKFDNPITIINTDGEIKRQFGWAVNVNVIEEFTMPKDLVGIGYPKSSWNRQHLRLGSPVIEPGWNGFLTISLNYVGDEDLRIDPGSGIMQVIFTRLESEAAYQGRYQNQANQVVGSIKAD
jgi:deoxycytidine triphosphate deaminase